ncbi:hypothetical protein [Micromonospora chersina]|uniref:hypothetical protein n=1 Tax=Micromonospora chersina TaxID=47854 RepID=UPI0037141F54
MINPWRLVDKIRTNAKTGLEPAAALVHVERVHGLAWRVRRDPGGVVVDGVVWPLSGEPPVAQGGNWWVGDSGSGGGPRTAPETTK